MNFKELESARETLELHDRVSLAEIKEQYKKLIKKWHPDVCSEKKEICEEKTRNITEAYKLLLKYCTNYKYSFAKDEVESQLGQQEWWMNKFGSDGLWGKS